MDERSGRSQVNRYTRRVVIAGGSGLLGSALTHYLSDQGFGVRLLSRKAGAGRVVWDGRTVSDWAQELESTYAVINLSGAPITLRWTPENRAKITSSRVESTKAIKAAIETCCQPPLVWINSSAIGIYGNRGDEELLESSELGPDEEFMAKSCKAWENACLEGQCASERIILRTGVVLSQRGGAFPVLKKLTRFFAGGAVGKGDQFVSWIHVSDLMNLFGWALARREQGIYNATAPTPVTNKELMATLRKHLLRPWSPPVPAFALRLITSLGGPETQPVLQGQRVIPYRAQSEGFGFEFPTLSGALNDLI